MKTVRPILFVALLCASKTLSAQSREEMLRRYPWVDTTGESNVYPVGDAVGVYTAALDLLYNDEGKRPGIIVMHDTAEGGSVHSCPMPCTTPWPHKSKMDTSTILAFVHFSPKRPGIRNFGYPVPIAFVSYRDIEQMEREGNAYIAQHKIPANLVSSGLRYAFTARFPGAWGLTQLSKVAFNTRHTEALVQIHNWCGENCASSETLFLKRIGQKWRVIERIPDYVDAGATYGNLRYRGPAGDSPEKSEIVWSDNATSRSESRDAATVYRTVLDSLYRFQGDSPSRIVVTDRLSLAGDQRPVPRTPLDSGLLQKYSFLRYRRGVPAVALKSRLPISVVLTDSLNQIDKIGAAINDPSLGNQSLWVGIKKVLPGIWGIVSLSPVAFNLSHTQALVFTSHQCGEGCETPDTWVLVRKGEKWRVVERIGQTGGEDWQPALFPLRYIGADAPPNAYHQRHVRFALTNAVTNQPLRFLSVVGEGNPVRHASFVSDGAGNLDLGTIPFAGITTLIAGCPDPSSRDSVRVGDFYFSPGSDTVVRSRVDFRPCLHHNEWRPLTGAQAFITANEARFVFPLRSSTELWDLPIARTAPGSTSFWWEVEWGYHQSVATSAPVSLWLSAERKEGQPAPKSLADLIRSSVLEAMVVCRSCDMSAVFADPDVDPKSLSATVENGRLVFIVRGNRAITHIFPAPPSIVTFSTRIRHKPTGKRELPDVEQSEAVLVNCRSSDSTAYSRRRCDAPTNGQYALPLIDSTGPRHLNVVAITYDGGSLAKNIDVLVRSEDRKLPSFTRSTGEAGKFSLMQPSRDSVSFHAFCRPNATGKKESGETALYLAPGRDTTIQVVVDPRRCAIPPAKP